MLKKNFEDVSNPEITLCSPMTQRNIFQKSGCPSPFNRYKILKKSLSPFCNHLINLVLEFIISCLPRPLQLFLVII